MGKAGDYQTISMGSLHTAAIKPDGSLWVWGVNNDGQIGNGADPRDKETYYQYTPVKVLDNVVSVSCGNYHTAAIRGDGSLWVWGSNEYGQVGSSNDTNAIGYTIPIQTTPAKMLDNVAAVSCGDTYTSAIKTDGTLWIWGRRYGSTPVKIMNDVVAVSGEDMLHGVIKKDGTLWMWGVLDTKIGPEGPVEADIWYTNPIKIASNVTDVSCGGMCLAYIKTDGTVWTWGGNSYGQRGDGTMDRHALEEELQPTQVKGLGNAVSINCGKNYAHVAVILADGSLWMWGSNFYGELGNGRAGNAQCDGMVSFPVQTIPIQVMDQAASVFCGSGTTAAIKSDGTLWTWGNNGGNVLGYQGGDRSYSINNGPRDWVQTTPRQVTDFTVKPSGKGAAQPSTPPAPTAAGFTDVRTTDYFADAVQWAVKTDITKGTSAATFSPNQNCSTAQILTFLWRAYGSPEPAGSNPFSDVKDSDYYAKAAAWAYEKGMVSSGIFGGDTPCTRSMAVTYMWKAAGSPFAKAVSFSDVSDSADYANAVAWAVDKGVTSGTSKTTFSPDNICTRGQIVTFLYRNMA